MEIIDYRKKWVNIPAVEILNKAIPVFRKENLQGIRRILLKDICLGLPPSYNKCHVKGRYCSIKNSKEADIELFFEWFKIFPEELKKNDLYLHFYIIQIFLHEIYHHIVRGQKRIKKMKYYEEENNCEKWAYGGAIYAVEKIFTKEEMESKSNEIKDFWTEEERAMGFDIEPYRKK